MTCPNCQTPNPASAVTCRNCGNVLANAPVVEGERKVATVLFADVVGSTALAEQLDPEDWAEIMNGEFAVMNAAVGRFGGTVARLMGDSILAFFGAPLVHEDDAQRAVLAALEIRKETLRYAESVRARHGVDLNVRVGLHTGLAILGIVGDRWKNEYTAMGDTTNVADRLQKAAEPGTILISSDTQSLISDLFEFDCWGPIAVKGRTAEIEVYQVLDAKPSGKKLRGLPGLTSSLVGRDAELAHLREKSAALLEGKGALVAVVGEAGLGKSRLVSELRSSFAHSSPGGRWLEGHALSYGQTLSYYPWRQLLLRAIGAHDEDGPDEIRTRLERELGGLGVSGDARPLLESLLGVESEASASSIAGMDGELLVRRVAETVRSLLRTIAAKGPAVIVLDDIHWADPASLELLRSIADLVRETPLLLLLVLRPEKSAPSWALLGALEGSLGSHFSELRLEPLKAVHSRELLGNLLHIENLPDSIRTLILSKSEGNPFFLEEVIRTLIDDELIENEAGRWRAKSEIVDVAIPDTLIGVLSARIDRLPQKTKRVAQTAAVIGRTFAQRVLSEVCASAPSAEQVADVGPHLGTLTYEELVHEGNREPELEYDFKHALTCEAAYDLLLIKHRREIHRRTATVLEQLYAKRLDDKAAVLAHHYLQAEEWERGAAYSLRAGVRAMKVYALEEALRSLDDAVRALEGLPEPPVSALIDAILLWADPADRLRTMENLEKRDKAISRLTRAIELSRQSGDQHRLARALMALANVHMLSGFPSKAVPPVMEAYELATRLGEDDLILLPFFLATDSMVGRDPRGAAEQFADVVEMARAQKNLAVLAHALAGQAEALGRLGRFEEAQTALAEALEIAPRSRSAIKEADVDIIAAGVFYDMGQVEKGIEYAKRGAERALSVRGLDCACAGYYFLGAGHLQANNISAAFDAFQRSKKLGEDADTGVHYYTYLVHGGLALVDLARGRPEALVDLEKSLANARQARDDYGAGVLGHAMAETYLGQGDGKRAVALLLEALKYYRATGMKPYIARALASLAEGYELLGQREEARQTRAEEDGLRAELGMPRSGRASRSHAVDPVLPAAGR